MTTVEEQKFIKATERLKPHQRRKVLRAVETHGLEAVLHEGKGMEKRKLKGIVGH